LVRRLLLVELVILTLAVSVVFFVLRMRMVSSLADFDPLLFFNRAVNPANGVTPIVPFTFLAMGFYLFGSYQLKRLFLSEHKRVRGPFGSKADRSLRKLLRTPLPALDSRRWATLAVASLSLSAVFVHIILHAVPSGEGRWFDWLMLLGFFILAWILVSKLILVEALWSRMRKLQQKIAQLPMAPAFSRIPHKVTAAYGPYLSTESSYYDSRLRVRLRQARLVARGYRDVRPQLSRLLESPLLAELDQGLEFQRIQAQSAEMARHDGVVLPTLWSRAAREVWPDHPTAHLHSVQLRSALAEASAACLHALQPFWRDRSLSEAFDADEKRSSPAKHREDEAMTPRKPAALDEPSMLNKWLQATEDFVAIETITFISQYFVQLRKQIEFLTLVSPLMLLAIVSYPFHPQQLALVFFWVLFLSIAGMVVSIFYQIEKDEIVSRVAGTTPHQFNLTWAFASNLLYYVVPLLGILAALSADTSDLIHSWIDPILRILH
jgi:hypothetical protein